jgi:hypothetical protein
MSDIDRALACPGLTVEIVEISPSRPSRGLRETGPLSRFAWSRVLVMPPSIVRQAGPGTRRVNKIFSFDFFMPARVDMPGKYRNMVG